METENTKQSSAAKFGMAGIAIALFMLGFVYVEVISMNSVVMATMLTMGAIAPFLAGIFEIIKKRSYHGTALILISLFFLTFYIFTTRTLGFVNFSSTTAGLFYIAWAIATFMLCLATAFKMMGMKNTMLCIILTKFFLFLVMLAIAEFTGSRGVYITAGVLALLTCLCIVSTFAWHIMKRMKKDTNMMME